MCGGDYSGEEGPESRSIGVREVGSAEGLGGLDLQAPRGGGEWHPQPDSNRCYQDENLAS